MTANLLFFVAHDADPQRFAVAPSLATAAARAGWAFDLYYDARRAGRHFGGGDPRTAPAGWAAGSLVAGGRHAEQVGWLAARYDIVAVGDPESVLWPALEAHAVAVHPTHDPGDVLCLGLRSLDEPVPARCLVFDGRGQGAHGVVTAPYVFPSMIADEPSIAIDVSASARTCAVLEAAGVQSFHGMWLDPARAAAFPRELASAAGEVAGRSYAEVTVELAALHRSWGQGVVLGDPDLVGAHLPRAVRRRLIPLYGTPQIDAIEAAGAVFEQAADPAWGRQYDDRDFLALARHGLGLQVIDPDPPFDSAARDPKPVRRRSRVPRPHDDADLRAWVAAGRVLATPLFWCGMVREVDALPRVIDLLATTGLKAGIVVTTETLAHVAPGTIDLLVAPPQRGGVGGQVELLLGSTGRGVAAEALLPPGALAMRLAGARREAVRQLPDELIPRGWWPLLDAPLESATARRTGWRDGVPVVWRGDEPGAPISAASHRDHDPGEDGLPALVRGVVGRAGRSVRLDRFVEQRRPFHAYRPGPFDPTVADAVKEAGFDYQWTKAAFGEPVLAHRDGAFVALPFTAGEWDGWSPFYTIATARDVRRAERRLLRRRRPGWLVSTIDTPLWALSGEILEHGPRLVDLAQSFTSSPDIVNVLPGTIAAYAKVIAETDGDIE